MEEPILRINGLSKKYGSVQALQDLNLTINKGSTFGILGPNGSGKTTTLSIILGAIHASKGSYSWFGGEKPEVARLKIGSLLEKPNFLPYLNAVDNLKMVATIKKVSSERINECLKKTGIFERRKSTFKTYSLGMKQRLALASVLLSDPDILVLDEPTNGLDPQGIVDIRELIQEMGKNGKTIILASHMLDEVEKVCTEVAILKSGTMRQQYVIGGEKAEHVSFEISADDMEELENYLKQKPEVTGLKRTNEVIIARFELTVSAGDLNRELVEKGIFPTHLKKIKESLESAFLNATGGKS